MMIRKICLVLVLTIVIIGLKAQCLVDFKEQIAEFEGSYLFHQEMNNRTSKRVTFVLNGGGAYILYLFNANKNIADYQLFNVLNNDIEPLLLEEKAKDYKKYRLKVDKTQPYEFELNVDSEERACVVIALLLADDFKEQTIQYAKQKKDLPPGTVRINERFFADKQEVRNVDWREFLSWIARFEGKDSEFYKAMLPDTTCWRMPNAHNDPLVEYYNSHPAYSEYPVVGVSYEQAKVFCQWRSDRVNESLYYKNSKEEYNPNEIPENIPEVFKYRLPTKEEWENFAQITYDNATEKKLLKIEEKGGKRSNFKAEESKGIDSGLADNATVTAPVKSYYPNAIGLYNVFGNVAEMLAEQGTAKGGGWVHSSKEASVKKDYSYTKPECWLGFRCVCERVD